MGYSVRFLQMVNFLLQLCCYVVNGNRIQVHARSYFINLLYYSISGVVSGNQLLVAGFLAIWLCFYASIMHKTWLHGYIY